MHIKDPCRKKHGFFLFLDFTIEGKGVTLQVVRYN